MRTRSTFLVLMSALVLSVGAMVISLSAQGADGTHYVRFQHGSTTAFGIREGETIKELKGDLGMSSDRLRSSVGVEGWVQVCGIAFVYLEWYRGRRRSARSGGGGSEPAG